MPMASAQPSENGSTMVPKYEPQLVTPDFVPGSTTTTDAGAVTDDPDEEPEEEEEEEEEVEEEEAEPEAPSSAENKWPGWPGHCVFRLIVPVLKVGSIIGRKGELIKKMCEETRARIRVLEGLVGTPDRIVLVSGKEEPEAPLSPAMDAVIRIFKRVSGLSESEGGPAAVAFCSIRLLVASTQAINLIGKQGSSIKLIQENSGASVRVLSGDDVPFYVATDERIVEVQGEALKVLKALEAVVGHLRKFLVDHSVLPLFEKTVTNNATVSQDRPTEPLREKLYAPSQPGLANDYPLSAKRESLYHDLERQLEPQKQPGISLYEHNLGLPGIRSSGLGRAGASMVTQIAQTMQIPLTYAEDIIGIGGANIAYIRRTSGAVLTVQESRGLPDEITVEIKGTSSQVQMAQQLIQEFMASHKAPISSGFGQMDSGMRSSYSHMGNTLYSSSSMSSQPYDGYGSSGAYGGYRL